MLKWLSLVLRRFRNAALESAERPARFDNVLHSLVIPTLLAQPPLDELSPFERLVFCAPFLTLLFPSSSAPSTLSSISPPGARPARQPRLVGARPRRALAPPHLAPPLDPPPPTPTLATHLPHPPESGDLEQALTDDDRRSVVHAVARSSRASGRGTGARARLTRRRVRKAAPADARRRARTPRARLARVSAHGSLELAGAVLAKFGSLGGDGDGVETRVAQYLFDLLDLAQREGDRPGGGVDVGSWMRAVHELHTALRWGDVVRGFESLLPRRTTCAPPAAPARTHLEPVHHQRHLGLVGAVGQPGLVILGRRAPRLLAPAPPLDSAGAAAAPKPPLALSSLASVYRVVALDDTTASGLTIKALAAQAPPSACNTLEFAQTLVRMAHGQGELAPRVHELLDRGCKTNPELVLVALTQIEKPWNVVHGELFARLLSTFLAGHPAHQLVFLRFYQVDRHFLPAALRDFYAEFELNVTRIVDIAQDLKAHDQVFELRPFVLALDLAALASRGEYLDLDKWLSSQFAQHGAQLVRVTPEFVGHKVQHELRRQELDHPPEPTTLAPNAAMIAIFMRVLRAHHELFSGNDVELFKEVRTQCL
ncbi:uncharacterized protein JCM10292_004118 [Rhodotorula paludigena]|uniref:uncharacterized protein n=1 Tax=Rhodotorula paludigena TaxID=86838 RepID=UPI00317D0E42